MVAFPCLLSTESKDKKREWTQIFADLGHPQEIAILDKKPRLVEIQDIDVVRVCATKAYDVWRKLGKPALVEDTGIEIEALNKYPGALYQSVQKGMGNIGLLQAMVGRINRKVTAKTAIGFASPDGSKIHVALGSLNGVMPFEEQGTGGFGYDSIVCLPNGKSLAELGPAEKNAISMRFKAIAALLAGTWQTFDVSESPLWVPR